MSSLSNGSLFGEFSRYQLVRHESHRGQEFSCWMVLDAERHVLVDVLTKKSVEDGISLDRHRDWGPPQE